MSKTLEELTAENEQIRNESQSQQQMINDLRAQIEELKRLANSSTTSNSTTAQIQSATTSTNTNSANPSNSNDQPSISQLSSKQPLNASNQNDNNPTNSTNQFYSQNHQNFQPTTPNIFSFPINLPGNFSLPQLDVNSESIYNDFSDWLNQFNRYTLLMSIPEQYKTQYLFLLAPQLEKIYNNFKIENESFSSVINKLSNYFNPSSYIYANRSILQNLKQDRDEPFDLFVTRLRDQIDKCKYDRPDEILFDRIVHGSYSRSFYRKIVDSDSKLSIDELIKMGRKDEAVNNQLALKTQSSELQINSLKQNLNKNQLNSNNKKSNNSNKKFCFKCGNSYPHQSKCPAEGVICHSCNKPNHFAKMCGFNKNEQNSSNKTRNIKMISNYDPDANKSTLDVWSLRIKSVTKSIFSFLLPILMLMVCQTNIQFTIDSGAQVDLIDEFTYNRLKFKPKLYKTSCLLMPYGSKRCIETLGKFRTRVMYNNQYKNVNFIVVKGNGGNLLSYTTSVLLGILNPINVVQYEKFINNKHINHYQNKFPNLFSDKIGLLKDKMVTLHIDQNVKPIQQKLRQIPVHLRESVEKEIKSMLENDIIEPVSGPTPWISPIVPVPKENGSTRICLDARAANKAILRQRHSSPTIDDLIVILNGATVFSKIDLKCGYNQLLLDPKSRYITAFSTHIGVFQFKRLVFGINTASEIFQKHISDLIKDINGTLNISDDIIVYGKSQRKHDENLNKLLERLNSVNLTINTEKCLFSRKELKFFGFNFSSKGISIDEKKQDALINSKPPTTPTEVRSFLGLASYCSKSIPNYSDLARPLRELTKQNVKFIWSHTHQQAFETLKNAISSSTTSYFDPKLKTEIVVDASPTGLAAVLLQYDQKQPNNKSVVMYVSRALTNTESKYSQVEREGLAVVWAVERLHFYLYGINFTIVTDNKAIQYIFNNSQSKPKARIERWCLRLSPYSFDIVHKPGVSNIADYFSRNPSEPADPKYDQMSERFIKLISDASLPKSIQRTTLIEHTSNDPILQEVKKLILNQKYNKNKPEIKVYEKIRNELSISNDGLILKNWKIVIPKSLQNRIVQIAHASHLGICKTKSLIRAHVWFPSIDKLVESTVNNCLHCKANSKMSNLEPIRPNYLPACPWEDIAIDFFGPLKNGKYLMVIIDEYTRYPIASLISTNSASIIIPKLNEIFAMFGIPKRVKTDNGPPFNSFDFKKFSQNNDFKHIKITPYWPRANGLVENFMKNLKKVLREYKPSELESRITEFLRNYRATPHITTGKSPYELMFKSEATTSKLPKYYKQNQNDNQLREKNNMKKEIMKRNADRNLKTKQVYYNIGDQVLLKNNSNKFDDKFDRNPYTIVGIKGSMISIQRDNVTYARNSSLLKLYKKASQLEQSESKSQKHNPFNQNNYATMLKIPIPQSFSIPISNSSQITNQATNGSISSNNNQTINPINGPISSNNNNNQSTNDSISSNSNQTNVEAIDQQPVYVEVNLDISNDSLENNHENEARTAENTVNSSQTEENFNQKGEEEEESQFDQESLNEESSHSSSDPTTTTTTNNPKRKYNKNKWNYLPKSDRPKRGDSVYEKQYKS